MNVRARVLLLVLATLGVLIAVEASRSAAARTPAPPAGDVSPAAKPLP